MTFNELKDNLIKRFAAERTIYKSLINVSKLTKTHSESIVAFLDCMRAGPS